MDAVAPTVDPNCPKPEGSTITPTVGEQLVVSISYCITEHPSHVMSLMEHRDDCSLSYLCIRTHW